VSQLDRAKKDIRNALIERPLSKMAVVVRLLPEIESALASGHSRKDCVDLLRRHGFDFTLGSFDGTLKRARRLSPEKRALYLGITAPTEPPARESGTPKTGPRATNNATLSSGENQQKEKQKNSELQSPYSYRHDGVLIVSVPKRSADINPIPSLDELF
jgi:hypothetical protein